VLFSFFQNSFFVIAVSETFLVIFRVLACLAASFAARFYFLLIFLRLGGIGSPK
jgi:hypothetical protein